MQRRGKPSGALGGGAQASAAVAGRLAELGVELRASREAKEILDGAGIPCKEAAEEDFSTEYIDMIISIALAGSVEDAANFVNTYGSGTPTSSSPKTRKTPKSS